MKTITIELDDNDLVPQSLRYTPTGMGRGVDKSTPAPQPVDEDPEPAIRHDTPLEVVIAAVCHEANRQYCRSIGDNSQLPWSRAPGWQQASSIALVRGVQSGDVTNARQNHELWMAGKIDDGWTYGPQKSEVAKTNPCIVDYDQLPPEQRRKDALLFAIATALLAVE